jgi:hypothetical protein
MDFFTSFGLSASAGLNAYIPLLVVSLLAKFTNWIELNSPWNALESWWVIGVLFILLVIEILVDKVPAVNHINDIIHTFIRPMAGAIVFAAGSQAAQIHPVLAVIAGLLIAGTVHATKSIAVRPAITASTAGTGNVPVSVLEDVSSMVLSIAAIIIPTLVAIVLVILISLLISWIWRRRIKQQLK